MLEILDQVGRLRLVPADGSETQYRAVLGAVFKSDFKDRLIRNRIPGNSKESSLDVVLYPGAGFALVATCLESDECLIV